MSLVAASLTKSAVVGAMPSVELTPVFSLTDWAKAAEDTMQVATARMAKCFMRLLPVSPAGSRRFSRDQREVPMPVPCGSSGIRRFRYPARVEPLSAAILPVPLPCGSGGPERAALATGQMATLRGSGMFRTVGVFIVVRLHSWGVRKIFG